jgi:hypothetical protein
MLADFDPKYPSTRAYFPSERLLATPAVRIRPAPHLSLKVFAMIGESIEKRASHSRRLWTATAPGSPQQQRLVKTGGRLIKHARYYWLLLAESHLTRRLFGGMLRRIAMVASPAG